MSALLYGASVKRSRGSYDQAIADGMSAGQASDSADNKLLVALAGLVPVEVIAAHGLILGFTTQAQADGTTKIVDAPLLQSSLIWLVLAGPLLFLAGRGRTPAWSWKDAIRALIPGVAVLAWMSLIGTSALTPWATQNGVAAAALGVAGTLVGLALLGASRLVADPKP